MEEEILAEERHKQKVIDAMIFWLGEETVLCKNYYYNKREE